jgi:hypothetical protein
LQDDKWLAKEVEPILTSGGSVSPGGTAPPGRVALSTGVPAAHKGVREARGRRCGGGFLVSAGHADGGATTLKHYIRVRPGDLEAARDAIAALLGA